MAEYGWRCHRMRSTWIIKMAIIAVTVLNAGCSQRVAVPAAVPAEVVLGNRDFVVTIRTAGAELRNEFGLRFDESAWVSQVTLGGRTFLREGYGLMEEYGITGVGVLGYDEVPVGGKFLKIGVRRLIRADDLPYRFWLQKQLDTAATTQRELREGVLRTTQTIGQGDTYGYTLTKCYRADPATATLRIEYTLTNRGTREFTFDQYSHNWFNFSRQEIDGRYQVSTEFPLDGPTDGTPWCKRNDKQLAITAPVPKPGSYTSNAPADARLNRFTLQGPAGQKMQVSGDFAVQLFRFYAQPDAICPEVMYQGKVAAGQTVSWTRIYQFANQSK